MLLTLFPNVKANIVEAIKKKRSLTEETIPLLDFYDRLVFKH